MLVFSINCNKFRQFEHILSNVYELCQKLGRELSAHKTGLSPPVTVSYLPFQVGASDVAHICKNTSGLVLDILRCQESASSSAGHDGGPCTLQVVPKSSDWLLRKINYNFKRV